MKNWLKSKLSPKEYTIQDGFNYWREKILYSLLFTLCIFGALALILGVKISIDKNLPSIIIIDSAAYLLLIFLFIERRIKAKTKSSIVIAIIYLMGLFFTLYLGPRGAGLIYIIGFSVLAAILIGLKGAFYSLAIQTITFIVIGYGLYSDYFTALSIAEFNAQEWFAVTVNVIVISSITTIPLALLVKGLKQTIDNQNTLQNLLKENITTLAIEKRRAEAADRLKSSFLANISHEVRTPLNAIIGFSDLIEMNFHKNEEEKNNFIKTIKESGHYLLNIINNILDISLIDTHELKYNIKKEKLETIFIDLKMLFNPRLNDFSHINLKIQDVSNNELELLTDALRLKQVFINLINNAIKFTDEGNIKVGYEKKETHLLFYIEDTGRGIDKDIQDKIFDRFTKYQIKTEVKAGTGLGLPISKGIIEELGGKMWLKSELNYGSTFFFTHPIIID